MAKQFRTMISIEASNLVAELPEDFDVERLEPVSVGVDEVEAAMHPVVHDVLAVEAALVAEVPLELEGKHGC